MDVDRVATAAGRGVRQAAAGLARPDFADVVSRHRRRNGAIAAMAVLAGGVAVLGVASLWPGEADTPPSRSTPSTAQERVTSTSSPPISLPSDGPLFGEPVGIVLLSDDGYDSVLALDPDARIGTRSVVEGQRPGDQPYRITVVDDHLVVGWDVVSASHLQTGERTILGEATIYVPAAEPGLVWLIDWAGGHIGQGVLSAWQVNMAGENATEPTEIDIDIEVHAAIGVPGGLALTTDDGIRLWYPDGRANELRLGEGLAYVIDAAGDLLAYCQGWPCTEIRIVDLVTGRTVTITDLDPIDPHGRFSPDGSQLAVTTFTDDVILADTATGGIDTVAEAVESENAAWRLAWAPDGRQLFANYISGLQQATIVRYDLDSRTADEVTLPFRAGASLVVVARSQVGVYLRDEGKRPADCPQLGGIRSGHPPSCGFGF